MNIFIKNNEKIKHLQWWDILIISLIMFGNFIYTSTIALFSKADISLNPVEISDFTSDMNWQSISQELILLAIVFIYI